MSQPLRYNNLEQITADFKTLLSLPALTQQQPFQTDNTWLDRFKANAILPQTLSYQGNKRLGFYYQWLWQQLITAHPDYELVAEEIQLSWNKQTLGAIDFLVQNKQTNELEHWEVAIKFYLAYQQQWLGPNANDNLDKKTQRMVEHQLMLCDHPAYQQKWQQEFGAVTTKRLIMQGRLFDSFDGAEMGSPLAINPQVSKGRWCFKHQAMTLITQGKIFKHLNKTQWITPPRFNELVESIDLTTLTTPTQAVDEFNQAWFIVPDHWPLHNKDLLQ
ncbi:hypothetical protein A3K86_06350 [Photobacterium jeanii]|uniref:DUF1853 domain-containing protein n=1 Tax=Photobacterium jeanii TaxID=858640 RepID=A0A178KNF9_9GAMM|nr:DUF1853 family protein [Photobacterium jeanii]OAN18505.1 hypothetical protein A3K86_06350 [Photobacterium jeanii]PST91813.1 DUF1853 domain-containing protein [Photobacterium jeanii]